MSLALQRVHDRPIAFARAEARDEDGCTQIGADRLAAKIAAFWRERGYAAPAFTTDYVQQGFVDASRGGRVDLRSDMLDGFPRARLEQA